MVRLSLFLTFFALMCSPNGYHVVSRSQCILNGTYEEFYSYRQYSLLGACEEDFEEDD